MSLGLRRAAIAAVLILAGCGRTGLGPLPRLVVQVVDEADRPVSGADIELVMGRDGDELAVEHARTDGDGVAIFAHPGPGEVTLHAATDLTCCVREGEAAATLGDATELVLVHARTGPCPTASPRSCGS